MGALIDQEHQTDVVTLVLAESSDVTMSLGRPGFLPERLRASNPDAPAVFVMTIPGERCDVVAQRLMRGVSPPDAPEGLAAWVSGAASRYDLPDSAKLVVLSMSEAMEAEVVRHEGDGWLVQLPTDYRTTWPDDHVAWLDQNCVPVPPDPQALGAALASIEDALHDRDITCMVYGVSTYTPDEKVYWFRDGDPEPGAITANRLNLILDSLDKSSQLVVVGVDRIVAEFGASDAVVGPCRYTAGACELIAEEAADQIAALPRISEHFSTGTMRLAVPRYDRRTQAGTLLEWHIAAPSEVSEGDPLFDVRFEHLHTRIDAPVRRESERSLSISVVATRSGYLREHKVTAGDPVEVGATVAVLTTDADVAAGDHANAPSFPVGVRLVTQ